MVDTVSDEKVIQGFVESYGAPPAVLIKAPGRVNLIGEHTDYNGLPVLPISIPFSIKVAASPRPDSTVEIRNASPEFRHTTFEIGPDIPHSETGHWSNYIKAAAQTIAAQPDGVLRGMNAFFGGDIPNSAGLSSSSALVVASALAVCAAHNHDVDLLELAEAMAYGEHYVGTQGGGMDQAISLLGKKDHAVKIDFFPLRYSYVSFPKEYSIVVAHSLVRAAKTENALLLYNRRPAECRLATAVINSLYQADTPLQRLGDLYGYRFFTDLADPRDFVDKTFPHESYTLPDIAGITNESPVTLTDKYLMTRSGEPLPTPPEGFLIRQRALHVLTEAARVEKSCNALAHNDAVSFGTLMDASHKSCDEQYGISTPELNALVSIMRKHGALGARLTGAGFGGCAVGLVPESDVGKVLDGVREDYYNKYLPETRPDLQGSKGFEETLLFAVKPANGATVTRLNP